MVLAVLFLLGLFKAVTLIASQDANDNPAETVTNALSWETSDRYRVLLVFLRDFTHDIFGQIILHPYLIVFTDAEQRARISHSSLRNNVTMFTLHELYSFLLPFFRLAFSVDEQTRLDPYRANASGPASTGRITPAS